MPESTPMGDGGADTGHKHVKVLAGTASSGKPVYEVLPARHVDGDEYEMLGSPALAYGFAAGDVLRVAVDGSFEVMRRGGNLCLRVYPTTALSSADVDALIAVFEPLGGLVETPDDRRFVVITMPVTSGFLPAEAAIGGWAASHACEWEYGNVYDEDGEPVGWWAE
ncbi:DUF4265 domain-containing protein [Hamadaea sp. NPDC051192]|uniref:DUF4265 domain-containing protein n=1 Tax=Hamadaea sp. NPDC051192 TaxID=3154940 RepID=UPI003437545B